MTTNSKPSASKAKRQSGESKNGANRVTSGGGGGAGGKETTRAKKGGSKTLTEAERKKKKERARRQRKRRAQKQQLNALIAEVIDGLVTRACNGGRLPEPEPAAAPKFNPHAPEFGGPQQAPVPSAVPGPFDPSDYLTGAYYAQHYVPSHHAAPPAMPVATGVSPHLGAQHLPFRYPNHMAVGAHQFHGSAAYGTTAVLGGQHLHQPHHQQHQVVGHHGQPSVVQSQLQQQSMLPRPPHTNIQAFGHGTEAQIDAPKQQDGGAGYTTQHTADQQPLQGHAIAEDATDEPSVLRESISKGLDEFVPGMQPADGSGGPAPVEGVGDSRIVIEAVMASSNHSTSQAGERLFASEDSNHTDDTVEGVVARDEEPAAFSERDEWLFDDSTPIQLLLDPNSETAWNNRQTQSPPASAQSPSAGTAAATSQKASAVELVDMLESSAHTDEQQAVSTEIKHSSQDFKPNPHKQHLKGRLMSTNGGLERIGVHAQVPLLGLRDHLYTGPVAAPSKDAESNSEWVQPSGQKKPPPPLHQLVFHFLEPWECGAVASVCRSWRIWLTKAFLYKQKFDTKAGPERSALDPFVSPLHPPPPAMWGVPPERHWMLHSQVLEMAASFTNIARTRRPWQLAVVNAARVAILQLWPGARVEIFGSFAHGLAGPGSDVDLVVCDVLAHYEWIMQGGTSKVRERPRESCAEQLGRHLQSLDWVQTVTVISSADVPVIKVSAAFQETGSGGISLDISFDGPNHRGIVTCALVAQLQSCYPSLRPLVLVLKHLLITKGLNQTYMGGISSYGLVLMVTAMLQVWDQHFYNHRKNLGTLLIFFLYLYGVLFHPSHYGIAILLTRDAMDPSHGKPSFSSLGPIYLRHTSRHRIGLQNFFEIHAPHLLVPPHKTPGAGIVRDADVLEHVRRIVNSYSQRQPGALYLDLRKRFGVQPGAELSMPDELIFINPDWSVDPLELMDPFDHGNNLGKNCFGILPLGAELAAALKRVQNVELYAGSTALGAIFSSQEKGGDHRHLIRLQYRLWSAPTDNPDQNHNGHSVSDILDTPATPSDPRLGPRASAVIASGGAKDQSVSAETTPAHGGASAPTPQSADTPSGSTHKSAPTKSATTTSGNVAPGASAATVPRLRTGSSDGSGMGKSVAITTGREQTLPHAVPSVVAPRLPQQASVVATQAKLVLEAMISRSLQVADGVRQIFSSNPVPTTDGSESPAGTRIGWWDMDWLARYMVHTHCSHTAIQHLLLEITLEFDRFSEAMGVLPQRKKWSRLVLRQSVQYALTLLGSASILTDDQTRHDLKAGGRWIGLLTLAQNRPLLHNDLDLKQLLEGSRVEDLVVIVPFVTNILMSAADSIVFQPPNPWTMGLVALLAQIYDADLPSVKLATKFEIVVLFETIGVNVSASQQRRLSNSSDQGQLDTEAAGTRAVRNRRADDGAKLLVGDVLELSSSSPHPPTSVRARVDDIDREQHELSSVVKEAVTTRDNGARSQDMQTVGAAVFQGDSQRAADGGQASNPTVAWSKRAFSLLSDLESKITDRGLGTQLPQELSKIQALLAEWNH